MILREVSTKSVEEWRAHPVTEALDAAFSDLLEGRRRALVAAFMAGQPSQELESGRVEVRTASALLDDLFGIDPAELADKLTATLERINDE